MHLHVHSNYSFLNGTLPIPHLIELAISSGMNSLALTDTNNVSGAMEFYVQAKSYPALKPILGVELKGGNESVVLLAMDWDGYQNICSIVSHVASIYPPTRVVHRSDEDLIPAVGSTIEFLNCASLLEIIIQHSLTSIICLSRVPSVLRKLEPFVPKTQLYAEFIHSYESQWGRLYDTAHELLIEIVASNDVYFGHPNGYNLHCILRTISTNTNVGTVFFGEMAHREQYLCSEEEFQKWFKDIPEALINREKISDLCTVDFDLSSSKFARYVNGECNDTRQLLHALCEQGFQKRYPTATPFHRERLEKELIIISDLDFIDYFLVAWDIVSYAKRRNYPYVGRGSGANSIVAYCLEITNVDPIELDLFFERFLNPERKSPPDFDIDFSWRYRDDVIDYVLNKYGEEHTAMIGTIATFNPRGALREVGKALGYADKEIKQVTQLLSNYGSAVELDDLSSSLHRNAPVLSTSRYGKKWLHLSKRILDFPNHYGIHAGGVILAPEEMTRYTATQVSAKGVRITQQDMFSMEDWRLEKLDILSTRGLGTFEDTMKMVEINTGSLPPIIRYQNACKDEATKRIMREGGTVGCFYVESPAMIQLLKKLRADSFEMLTAASSIIRPGVAQSGMMQAFIERFHDPTKINPPHPIMAKLLASTFGVMVYQEDVIKVANFIGGMSFGEADLLRRAMSGKLRSREAMMALRDSFYAGCVKQGMAMTVIDEIWRQMESFAGYSFCKAHSASYAVLSFQEAYLKVHYPAYFLCSVLNNQGGYYRPEVYIQEAKKLSIRLFLPSVNRSAYLHTCPDDRSIQLGFLHIKHVSESMASRIINERLSGGSYREFGDFLSRSGLSYEPVSILVSCGACDCFDHSRPALMMQARMMLHGKGDVTLPLEFEGTMEEFKPDLESLPEYSAMQTTQIEQETFSFTVSSHVLEHFASALVGTRKSGELTKLIGKRVVVGGWMVAAKVSRTKRGEKMMFMNLDDSTGMIDVVLFPKCYDASNHFLRTAGPYRIEGRVAMEYGVVNVIAEKVTLLSEAV